VFKVRVYLPPKTAGLYPGMFVKTAFRVGEEQRLTVPRQALAQRGEVSACLCGQGRQSQFAAGAAWSE
jgi:hypothetical protein